MRGALALAVTLVETIGEPTLLLAFVALPIKLETGPIAGKYEIGGCFGLRRDVHTLTGRWPLRPGWTARLHGVM